VVSCHYGDLFWIRHLLDEVARYSDERVKRKRSLWTKSRDSAKEISAMPLVREVLTFEPDAQQIAVEGHDHPYALDRAIHDTVFTTSHVIVMDSDAFPVSAGWLDAMDDISLALVPGSNKNTHPCFMVFPVADIPLVSFFRGVSGAREPQGGSRHWASGGSAIEGGRTTRHPSRAHRCLQWLPWLVLPRCHRVSPRSRVLYGR